MFVIPELKHNRFKKVDVPKPSELYKRFGFGQGSNRVSGDTFLDPSKSKIDQVAEVAEDVRRANEESPEE